MPARMGCQLDAETFAIRTVRSWHEQGRQGDPLRVARADRVQHLVHVAIIVQAAYGGLRTCVLDLNADSLWARQGGSMDGDRHKSHEGRQEQLHGITLSVRSGDWAIRLRTSGGRMMQPVDAAPGCLMLSPWISRLLRPNVCVPGRGERRIAPGTVFALLNGWLTDQRPMGTGPTSGWL